MESSRNLVSAPSSLMQLRDLLDGPSPQLHYQILELDFPAGLDPCRKARLLRNVDAERSPAALRQSGIYEVDPPKTETLKEGGVASVFVARPRSVRIIGKAGN